MSFIVLILLLIVAGVWLAVYRRGVALGEKSQPTTAMASGRGSTEGRGAGASVLGSWWFAVIFLGWIGGLIGYFTLKDSDPSRANAVAKWGFISTACWLAVSILFYVILVGFLLSSTY